MQVFAYDANDRPNLTPSSNGASNESAQCLASEGVGITTALPLADNQSIWWMGGETRFTIDDRPLPVAGSEPLARLSAIDGALCRSDGHCRESRPELHCAGSLAICAGRDGQRGFRSALLPDRDPVGQRITIRRRGVATSREVVGVLAGVRAQGLESASGPEIYVPAFQTLTTGGVTFVIKTGVEPSRVDQRGSGGALDSRPKAGDLGGSHHDRSAGGLDPCPAVQHRVAAGVRHARARSSLRLGCTGSCPSRSSNGSTSLASAGPLAGKPRTS